MSTNKNQMFSDEMIQKLLHEAIGIQKGEVILLQFWGEEADRELLHRFSNQVAALGASPVELQHDRSNYSILFKNMKEGCFSDNYYKIFDAVDIVIDICMYRPVMPASDFPKESMEMYRTFMGKLFQTFIQKKKLVQLRIPTMENAMESGLSYEVYEKMMTKAYKIDYLALKKKCEAFIKEIGNATEVIIYSGEQKQLTMSIEERSWEIDGGDGDLPCGEVSIAPIEDKTNGEIFFEILYYEDINTQERKKIENITITVQGGKMLSSNSAEFNEYLENLPLNGNVICEFGIGMNDGVDQLTGYELLDEKMLGTFHIAIGNNTMFGGKNDTPLHQDFVGRGEVFIGNKQVM
jgi:leucyl aminopeptidase (aminopeptidase T)